MIRTNKKPQKLRARNKTSLEMAVGYALPPPAALDIHDSQASEKWKKFKLALSNYAMATEHDKKSEAVQVATLLAVIGEEARDVFLMLTD